LKEKKRRSFYLKEEEKRKQLQGLNSSRFLWIEEFARGEIYF